MALQGREIHSFREAMDPSEEYTITHESERILLSSSTINGKELLRSMTVYPVPGKEDTFRDAFLVDLAHAELKLEVTGSPSSHPLLAWLTKTTTRLPLAL